MFNGPTGTRANILEEGSRGKKGGKPQSPWGELSGQKEAWGQPTSTPEAPGRGSWVWSGAALSPEGLPKRLFCRAWIFAVFPSLLIYSGRALLAVRLARG